MRVKQTPRSAAHLLRMLWWRGAHQLCLDRRACRRHSSISSRMPARRCSRCSRHPPPTATTWYRFSRPLHDQWLGVRHLEMSSGMNCWLSMSWSYLALPFLVPCSSPRLPHTQGAEALVVSCSSPILFLRVPCARLSTRHGSRCTDKRTAKEA